MQSDKLEDVRQEVSDMMKSKLSKMQEHAGLSKMEHAELSKMQEHAERFAHDVMDRMVEQGDAIKLTDDEERLLKSYRQFVIRSKPGAMFSWRSLDDSAKIVTPDDPCDLSLQS